MVTISVHAHYGFHPWLARITGRDQKFGLCRSFVSAAERSRSRSGATGNLTWILDTPGLYQLGGSGHDNELFLLWEKDGRLVKTTVTAARAWALAKLLDAGTDFEAARLATKPATA